MAESGMVPYKPVKIKRVQVCNGLSMGCQAIHSCRQMLLHVWKDLMILVQQLIKSRVKSKAVQQCRLGSTLLASFECCNPVCRISITADTRTSRQTDTVFLQSAGPISTTVQAAQPGSAE